LKSQNYKNISDLSIGFASITSEFHIYLLRLFGQTEFSKISFTLSSEPPDFLLGTQRLASFRTRATGFSKIINFCDLDQRELPDRPGLGGQLKGCFFLKALL
jgi:hypothetical protein